MTQWNCKLFGNWCLSSRKAPGHFTSCIKAQTYKTMVRALLIFQNVSCSDIIDSLHTKPSRFTGPVSGSKEQNPDPLTANPVPYPSDYASALLAQCMIVNRISGFFQVCNEGPDWKCYILCYCLPRGSLLAVCSFRDILIYYVNIWYRRELF